MAGDIAKATRKLYQYYDSIRGKSKEELGDGYWDLVVLTASDKLQRDAFEKQIDDKLRKKEIPSGIPYLVYADPPGPRAGCGGSTLYVISELEKKYGWNKLGSWRVLLLNAGGQSQRLPSASVLGKIFGVLPVGCPMYQMLDIKLASYLPFLKKMAPGIFHGPSDTIEVYAMGNTEEANASNWDFRQAGFTALAHPSSLKIGTGHGVYVLEENGTGTSSVEQRICLQVLQKPSIEKMKEKKAVFFKNSQIGPGDNEFVYTDSAFFFDHEVAKKLMEFYRKEMPLNCEIDAYGDFLQALGPKATAEYTKDTKNVGKIEDNLVKMREKIYHLLKGTPLTIIALNESQFHHFGTIAECLDHFCEDDELGKQMGFMKWVSSKVIQPHVDDGGDEGSTKAKKARVEDEGNSLHGCVMASALHKDSVLHKRCMVEYCHFDVPIDVECESLISNCQMLAEDAKHESKFKCPANAFIHTIPVNYEGEVKFATVIFASEDNLKRKVPLKDAGELVYFGQPLKDIFGNAGVKLNADAFKDESASTASLWTLKLFPLADTMSQSFLCSVKLVETLLADSKCSMPKERCVSMADIMEMKDVSTMLKYRNKLAALISV